MMSGDTHVSFMQPRLSPGTRLNGIYEIDHPIGLGGMGEIYKGHLIETGDPVAIKMMLAEFSTNDTAFALFRKEASALHHIQHDAIVRYYVFTIEPALRRPYLAMEFVDGRTLADLVNADGPLSLEAIHLLLRRLASGLQAAHEHGIVHRDISPDNIIVPNNDVSRAKIIDFGIARTAQHGTIIGDGFAGKLSYVSPEQLGLFGGEVSARSDIYSLGLVLAEALTGKALDMSGSQFAIVEKRRRLPNLGAIDLRIRPLLELMLQPDPAKRPESMAAVVAWSLAAFNVDRQSVSGREAKASAKPQSSAARRWRYIAAGALVVAGSISLVGFRYFHTIKDYYAANTSTYSPAKSALPISQQVRQFVDAYDGGNCFFVTPIAVGEHAAAFEGFGASVEPFQSFDSAFRRQLGFEAEIGVREINRRQCAAVSFLARLSRNNAKSPHLEIERESLRDGDVLRGLVDRYGSGQLALLLVSASGVVQNVTNLLKSGTDAKIFSIGMKRTDGSTQRQPQLLLAITSLAPVGILQSNSPIGADQFFPGLTDEATKLGTQLGATARYFVLEN
jgi:serine/threonine-protein kinase